MKISFSTTVIFILSISFHSKMLQAQQPTKAIVTKYSQSEEKQFSGRHKYLSLSFNTTTGMKGDADVSNPLGGSISYLVNPANRNKPTPYYIGILFSIAGYHSSDPIYVPGANSSSLNSRFATIFIGLEQRYFFRSKSKTIPFIDLDLGWRFIQHQLDAEYKWSSKFLGYSFTSSTTDNIYKDPSSQFAIGLKAGCFFKVFGLHGLFIKAGVDTSGEVKVADKSSVRYLGIENYQFDATGTKNTNSLFVSIDLGLII